LRLETGQRSLEEGHEPTEETLATVME